MLRRTVLDRSLESYTSSPTSLCELRRAFFASFASFSSYQWLAIRSFRRKRRMADREGFEPSVTLLLHTLSKRAHSTTLTSVLIHRVAGRGVRTKNRRLAIIFGKKIRSHPRASKCHPAGTRWRDILALFAVRASKIP